MYLRDAGQVIVHDSRDLGGTLNDRPMLAVQLDDAARSGICGELIRKPNGTRNVVVAPEDKSGGGHGRQIRLPFGTHVLAHTWCVSGTPCTKTAAMRSSPVAEPGGCVAEDRYREARRVDVV